MLKVEGLEVKYGQVSALRGIDLRVDDGEAVVLIGANGAGKTTTLQAISGLVPISAGRILWGDTRAEGWPPHRRVRAGLIQVPEGRKVFPDMTVMENLDLGGYASSDSRALRSRLDRVFEIFPVLADRQRQAAGTLSGGEQQMLAIGRGLAANPLLLMLDEPSLGLAPNLVDQILEVLVNLNRDGTTLLLVEQNANLALSIADRGYVLETGKIVLEGRASDLKENDSVRGAYLGL